MGQTNYSNNFKICNISLHFLLALRPNGGHGLLISEVAISHTATYHSR